MRLNVMLEPQEGLSYADILAVAQRAEALGFDGLYRADHYTSVAGRVGLASTDAWATLAGLARETRRLRIGALVSPVTFRPAGNLAKVVATVAEMAGTTPDGDARVVLGLGAGWQEQEHRAFGFPFEDVGTRFRRLEEHLQIVTALWDPDVEVVDFDGEFERLQGNHFAPVPSPRPRLVVGGNGPRTTPRLAATYADELNCTFQSPAGAAAVRANLEAACEAVGRDPASIRFTLMTGCLVGADHDEYRARLRRFQEESQDGRPLAEYEASLDGEWLLGTPERVAERLGAYADAGVEAVMLQHRLVDDLDMLDVVAEEVAPRVGVALG